MCACIELASAAYSVHAVNIYMYNIHTIDLCTCTINDNVDTKIWRLVE